MVDPNVCGERPGAAGNAADLEIGPRGPLSTFGWILQTAKRRQPEAARLLASIAGVPTMEANGPPEDPPSASSSSRKGIAC